MADKPTDQNDQETVQYADYMQSHLSEVQQLPSSSYLKGKRRFVIQGKFGLLTG
jgi:hypothetical protein